MKMHRSADGPAHTMCMVRLTPASTQTQIALTRADWTIPSSLQLRPLSQVGRVVSDATPPQLLAQQEYGGCSASTHMARSDVALSRAGTNAAQPRPLLFLPDEANRRIVLFDVNARTAVGGVNVNRPNLLQAKHFTVARHEWLTVVADDHLQLHELVTPV